jgi:hypothetical protein
MTPEYRIVEVQWFDAQSYCGPAEDISYMIENMKPELTYSVGYLLNECKESILLGFILFNKEKIEHAQLIPRGMVRTIRYINEKEL